ncbi:M14 family zinc carboxypeptidase, partial [uncultured Massilia sp.]
MFKVIAGLAVVSMSSLWTGEAGAAAAPEVLFPAPAWHGASEKHIAPPGERWITPAEKSGFVNSPSYTETVAFLASIAAASDLVTLHTFGKSYQGRDLVYALARKPGPPRPVVLVQAGIHAGEIDGKDAGLMLLRDIALRGRADLLDRVDLVFVPILNVDGHEHADLLGRPGQRGPGRKGARS